MAVTRSVKHANALRAAIEARAIQVAWQPKRQYCGAHAGFEVLARWHDGRHWVPPSEFIPIAEEIGLDLALGQLVLEKSLERAGEIARAGGAAGRLAINLSGGQMADRRLGETLAAALDRQGLAPADLELEITESVILGRSAAQVKDALWDLHGRGFSLTLDDFGTGFASLIHLHQLPISALKIDRSFVAAIGTGAKGEIIVRTIIALARSLDMESVAEGVETQAQLDALFAGGCDAAQGYLIARPLLTADKIISYLQEPHRRDAGARPCAGCTRRCQTYLRQAEQPLHSIS